MLKSKLNIIVILALVLVLALSAVGAALAAAPGQVDAPPTLKLTVTKSPLTTYPPTIIYTAQLSYVPPTPTTLLKVDFYNTSGTVSQYLGSAQIDATGQAVLKKQMAAGTYVAISKIVINTQTIWSNSVKYSVP